MDSDKVQSLIRELLVEIGEDPKREGLRRTPLRVAEALAHLTSGYGSDAHAIVNGAIFSQESNNLVVVRNIEIYSLCEHHLLPFFGRCHIGYLAEGKVIGISKVARLADMYSRRLQLQERLTEQLAHAIMNELHAQGTGVVIEARHLCMMMRGVEKQNSAVVTSSLLGSLHDSHAARMEFLSLVGRPLGST
jgi:GTP cyclohydrolase IA